ncbi:transglycosylase family protein [Mycobacterium adipatum]|uniref:transglycosylase family protein n=1 Tax=Mycobacterium adipatum TaxID=1682113 RepID=UPI0034E0B8D9
MAIHIDVLPDLERRQLRNTARDIQRDMQRAGMEAGKGFGDQFGAGVQKSSPKIERGLNRVADATGRVRVEQERLNNMQKQGATDSSRLVAQSERLAKARRDESAATRALARDMQALNVSSSGNAASLRGTASALAVLGGAARSPAGIAALIPLMGQLGAAAVTASGSLLVLPGVIGAVGAAFGTLKLATAGLDDAFKNMDDPEKLAEALKKISPNAQQAVLSIQALMPALTQFKNVTQDALFAGVGTQLNSMASALLPQIQQMTTSVASSFNKMFMGATNTLMANPALVQNITNNISAAFQSLAPAAATLTKALAELVSTGSDFLPRLAQGAANAAQSFANFMTEASKSGQLEKWINDGITVVRMLKDAVAEASRMFMALGGDGKSAMSDIVLAVNTVSTAVRVATGDLDAFKNVFPTIGDIARKTFEDIASTIDTYVLGPLRAMIDLANKIPGVNLAQIPDLKRGPGLVQGGGGSFDNPGALGIPGVPAGGYTPPTPGSWWPGIGLNGQRGGGFYTQGQEGYAAGMAPDWATGAGGAGGGSASGPVVPYTGDPMSLLQGMPVDAQLYSAAGTVLDSQHRLEQSKAELNALMQSNDATAEQIQEKRNDVALAEREAYEAELRLIEAKQSATEKFTNTMGDAAGSLGEIGAALDADLGISKGLPGLAENLVRFLGSLAAAPVIGALSGVQQGLGYQPGSAGKGLFGMLAAQGAFGSQYQIAPGMLQQQGGSYGPSGGYAGMPSFGGGGRYGLPAGTNTGGYGSSGAVFPPWVHQLESMFGVKASTYSGHQESDRHEPGYAPNPNGENRGIDWSGPVDAMQRFADYLSTIPGALEQVIWQNPNTGQTTEIAGGQFQPGYFSGALGGHQNHVHTRQSASLPVPGGMPAGPWSADWNAIAQAESGGNWGINTGNGYSGGLQFAPGSWAAAGGSAYAPSAHLASPFQQAMAAENLLKLQGPGAWPNTFVPGSSGPMPPMGWGGPQGIPSTVSGGGGQSPVFGARPGMPLGSGAGAPVGGPQTGMGSQAYSNPVGGEGFAGLGGLPMAAIQGAISAGGGAGSMFGGQAAAAAAQVGMELANRAVAFGGQAASIGVSGLMETFLPSGDNANASISNSWLGRIAGGLAGARPATPNMAGQAATPEQKQQGQESGQPQTQQGSGQNGEQVGVKIENYNVTKGEDRAGQDLARHQQNSMQAGMGKR